MHVKKIAIAALLAATWKQAAATGITAAVVASQIGSDPIPWAIGAFGATVMYAYGKPTSRPKAIVNGGLSVLLGGVGAPWVAALAGHYLDPVWNNPYIMSLGVSAAWPWLAKRVALIVDKQAEKIANG